MNERPFELTNPHGDLIRGDLHIPKGAGPHPAVVLCHGFKGFKDWGFFPTLARYLAQEGFVAVSFNFSHSGIGEDPLNFTRLDLFAENTFSLEQDDLGAVLDWTTQQPEVDASRMGLLGHSRGGATVLIRAFSDADPRVRCLVTWNSIARVDWMPPSIYKVWRRQGYFNFHNARTRQDMHVSTRVLDDFEANRERLTYLPKLRERALPWLLLHAAKDESVPVQAAHELYEHAHQETTRLFIKEKTGHTFNSVHPFAGITPSLDDVLIETGQWFREHL
jgi:uncharacterized protein